LSGHKTLPLKILVTGFGPFPGARHNPTAVLVDALEHQKARFERFGLELQCAVLPVHYAKVAAILQRLDETLKPSII
jgi:pyroglutamyl-peptidase